MSYVPMVSACVEEKVFRGKQAGGEGWKDIFRVFHIQGCRLAFKKNSSKCRVPMDFDEARRRKRKQYRVGRKEEEAALFFFSLWISF